LRPLSEAFLESTGGGVEKHGSLLERFMGPPVARVGETLKVSQMVAM
jgi:hypothetical protein